MYENDVYTDFDPSEVVAFTTDDWSINTLETYSEVSAEQELPTDVLLDIRNDISTIKNISLLIFVAILLIFIFRFLFGQLSAWFSC